MPEKKPKEVNTAVLKENEEVQADEASKALLREFMDSKKFKKTLGIFDEEVPRGGITIASRALVRDMLVLQNLVDSNKEAPGKWKTLLELICNDRINKREAQESNIDSDDPEVYSKQLLEKIAERDALATELAAKTKQLKKQKKLQKEDAGKKQPKPGKSRKHSTPTIDDLLEAGPKQGKKKKREKKNKRDKSAPKRSPQGPDDSAPQERLGGPDDELKNFYKELKEEAEERAKKEAASSTDDNESESDESNTQPTTPTSAGQNRTGPKQADWIVEPTKDNDETASPHRTSPLPVSNDVMGIMDVAPTVQGRPIPTPSAKKLKEIICGAIRMPDPWLQQGFYYNPTIKYGLVQNMGGPCGLLAVIQARVVKHLILDKGLDIPTITEEDQREALLESLVDTLTVVADGGSVLLCLPSDVDITAGKVHDKILLDSWRTHTLGRNRADVRKTMQRYLSFFMERRGLGLMSLLVSAINTRGGPESVSSDMDGGAISEGSLIVCHQYSSQELVSLLLFGRAYSNVFDKVKEVGGMTLRGVPGPSPIGLLTYQEYTRDIEVGGFLKNPTSPIWTIWNESHYCVCFSKTQLGPEDGKADLYYYDQLGSQDEEYHLTVDGDKTAPLASQDDLTPYMDDILRTRTPWARATVSWNGSEPLL
eukprot:TRINITY_DN747_c3_g2_i1.p1 TRINITY_DN747_c3_g2~~TRINITY_DN747_c3_g2_i1.p1  ORF type:complete len:652 (+),score=157.60 TRINITY_DN747_c3_g2_i1:44-1999(+)